MSHITKLFTTLYTDLASFCPNKLLTHLNEKQGEARIFTAQSHCDYSAQRLHFVDYVAVYLRVTNHHSYTTSFPFNLPANKSKEKKIHTSAHHYLRPRPLHFPALGLRVVDDFPAFEGAEDTLGKADGESLIDGAALGAAEYSGQTPALVLFQPKGMAPPLLLSK